MFFSWYDEHGARTSHHTHWFKHILFRRKGLGAAYNATMPSPEEVLPYTLLHMGALHATHCAMGDNTFKTVTSKLTVLDDFVPVLNPKQKDTACPETVDCFLG